MDSHIVPSPADRPRQLRARRLFRSPGLTALGAAGALCLSALGATPAAAALVDADAIVETADDAASGSLTLVLETDAPADLEAPAASGAP